VLQEGTQVYDPFTGTVTQYGAVPYLRLHVFAAGGDDIHFGYLVSPPDTYSLETVVAPPADALNSERSQARLAKHRACLAKATQAFQEAYRM